MISVGGVKATTFNLRNIRLQVMKAAEEKALKAMGAVALDAVRINTSRRDYTLQQLADMGHPYARRHGTIQVHPDKPYVVHQHSGRLLRSVDGKIVRKGKNTKYRVGFINGPPLYAKFVVKGTKIMLERDVIVETVNEKDVKKRMLRAVVTVMGKEMRTQSGLRFGGL